MNYYSLPLLLISLLSSTSFASEPSTFSGIISAHNTVRVKHQQVPLSWSNNLAQYAQQWVDHLAITQNCAMVHRPNYGGGNYQQKHGENLFWASPEEFGDGSSKAQQVTSKEVVKAWAEEERFYSYENNRCVSGEDCGHYTQMVWHESRQVGCALAVCPDKSQIWACNYHPRGNYIGEWPY